jgi:hypothetical protein
MQSRGGKQATKVAKEGVLVVELAPGHADNSPSCGLKAAVAFAIHLECDARAVRFTAIQLNDHPLGSPKAIGLDFESVQVEENVELGPG